MGIISRFLSTDSFGNFSAIQNSANSGNMIGSLGIPVVLQLKTANISEANKEEMNDIISNSIMIYLMANIIVCLILLLFPDIFTKLLLNSSLNQEYNFHLILLILLTAINQIPLYVLIGLGEFKEYAVRNLAFNAITLLVTTIFLFLWGQTLNAALVALYFSNIVTIALTFVIFKRVVTKYHLKIHLIPNAKYARKILSSGFFYYMGNTFLVAVSGLVTISVFYTYLTPNEYGFLRIASAISVILSIIPAAIQPVNLSKIFLDGDQSRLKSLQIRIIPFITILIYLVLSPNLPILIPLLFGPEFTKGMDFIFYVILLQVPAIYLGIFSNFLTAKGNLNFIGFVSVAGTITLMLSLTLLTPIYKLDAYIYSVLLTTAVSLILVLFKELRAQKYVQKFEILSFLVNIFIIALNLIWVFYYPHNGIFITLTLLTAFSISSYLFCFSDEEKIKLKHHLWLRLSSLLKR